jgi:hypothetical protein
MRILMSKCWEAPEYLDDGLLIGLRELFGNEVVEYPRMWHMYADSFGAGKRELSSIAARGFTLYGFMDDSSVDRTDLEMKIRTGFFDLIIMHPWYPSPLLHLIFEYTPKTKIIWIDGRDETEIIEWTLQTGRYFKRELLSTRGDVLPISFGFPDKKIQKPLPKIRDVAPLIPGRVETYVYVDEAQYYRQYNESGFGITFKKNGWDCLRHYEIMGAQCVPAFLDIVNCPPRTCTTLPKSLLLEVNAMIARNGTSGFLQKFQNEYNDLAAKIQSHFQQYCTTTYLAKYVLDNVMEA